MFEKIVIISRIKVSKNLSLKHNKFSNFFSNFQAIHKKIDSNNLIKSLNRYKNTLKIHQINSI